jgi:hypothetical protein
MVVPRDRFGNCLLVGPITAGRFGLVTDGAGFECPLTSHLACSHSQPLAVRPGTVPNVGFTFNGQNVLDPVPVAPPDDLHYVDHVINYESGAIVSANRHAEPDAALGSVIDKTAERDVSLGASDQLTVGIRGAVIRATENGDEVTVFVASHAERRSYRLETHDAEGHEWRTLGESIGITEAFSLRGAGTEAVTAVRIIDTSGRVRGPGQVPLESPGAGIRGVGVRKLSRRGKARCAAIWRLIRHSRQRISMWLGRAQ